MKKTLIIGSTVLDIIIEVDELPKTTGDLHVKQQHMVLGGCAYNVANIISLFMTPHLLCSPIGRGIYGDYVAKKLKEKKIKPFIRIENQDNGCCYCYVEPSGERSFLSYHGAEYVFLEEWMNDLDMKDFDSAYICGFEVEEKTGSNIISFLKKHSDLEIYFAPGPRFPLIEANKIKELFKLSPVLHLNKEEIMTYTHKKSINEAACDLFKVTNNTIIITDGDNGSYYYGSSGLHHVPGLPSVVVDTIGAGDSHFGAFIACSKAGLEDKESLKIANQVAAKVVASKGSALTKEDFDKLLLLK